MKEPIEQVYNGDLHWYDGNLTLICCHCGLWHKVKMGVGYIKGKPKIWFRFWEMNAATRRYRLSEKMYVDVQKRIKKKSANRDKL